MGAGWFEREHRAFGFPFPQSAERFDMLEEQVEIVHRLLATATRTPVTFEGRHYRLEAVSGARPSRSRTRTRPLILGGGAGPERRASPRAGRTSTT